MPSASQSFIDAYLAESAAALAAFQHGTHHHAAMDAMAVAITAALRDGRKLLIAGNGGSAGDAQHIAGEFVSRLMFDRAPLAAIALTTDTSVITATGNDYGYDHIFERQILALGRPGDIFLAISTSGRSPNILRALSAANAGGLVCAGFAGQHARGMREHCALLLEAPSERTAIVQQIHITAAHIVCALVERAMFPDPAFLDPGFLDPAFLDPVLLDPAGE